VLRADLAAPADDARAVFGPRERETGVGLRAEVVAGAEDVDGAPVLQRVDGREGVGVASDEAAERAELGQRGAHGLWAAAVDEPGGDRDAGERPIGLRERLAAAQPRRTVVGERPRHPHRLAALGGGRRRGPRLLGGGHRLAQHQVDAPGLLRDDAAVDGQCRLVGDGQLGVVAAEERREAAGDAHVAGRSRGLARLLGEVDRALLQRLEHALLALPLEPLRRRRVGIHRDHARAGADELGMQVAHERGLVEQDARRPERRRRRRRAPQELLAHAAVGEDDLAHPRIVAGRVRALQDGRAAGSVAYRPGAGCRGALAVEEQRERDQHRATEAAWPGLGVSARGHRPS
jgi:hypothetical protein